MRKPEVSDMTPSVNGGEGEVGAFLESLTGPSRGNVNWLVDKTLTVSVDDEYAYSLGNCLDISRVLSVGCTLDLLDCNNQI